MVFIIDELLNTEYEVQVDWLWTHQIPITSVEFKPEVYNLYI